MSKTVLILGAGPAGLFCAHELLKNGIKPTIIEKTNMVGGLAATYHNEYGSFEIGPHIFHTDDQYIFDIAKSYLGDDLKLKKWNVGQYIEGKLFEFPNSLKDMTSKLGWMRMLGFIISYVAYQFIEEKDFRTFIYKKVGRKLAHFNVINYTEKMWGIPLEELEVDWIKPRMNRLSIWKIIKTVVTKHKRTFHYPKYGAGSLYTEMAKHQDVRLNEWPLSIESVDDYLSIITNKNTYIVDHLISSIPITELLSLIKGHNSTEKYDHLLLHRAQVYVMLTYNKANLIPEQWIYFPEQDIPFCRVHSAGAFSSAHISGDHTILVFEYFCFKSDDIWNLSNQDILTLTITHFDRIGLRKGAHILDHQVIKQAKAYPLMNKDRVSTYKSMKSELSQHNIHLIGRHGLHTYDNQDEAGRTAIDMVNNHVLIK